MVFGRILRDALPLQPGKFRPRLEWRLAADKRAEIYSKRKFDMQDKLTRGSRLLQPLSVGDHVLVQDQHGKNPRQWSQAGVVVELGSHDSYLVSIGGSRRVTRRNRQFLRKIAPQENTVAKSDVKPQSVSRSLSSQSTTPPLAPKLAPTPAPCSDPFLPSNDPIPYAPLQDPDAPTPCTTSMELPSVVQPIPSDDVQPVPPLKLRRSGADDRWIVAGQRYLPPHMTSSSFTPPSPPCMGHVWPLCLGIAPTFSCPTHLPRFG